MMYTPHINPMTQAVIGVVKLLPDGTKLFIPSDPNNKDYQEYLEWVAQGGQLGS